MNTRLIESNGFRLVAQIDDTSRTAVWKAVQVALDRTVIIRVLKPDAASDPSEVEHFLTVSRLFARIKSESVAAVFDIVSQDGLHYVVMEHVEGPTLEELVSSHGPLPSDHALRIAASLINSLEQMWNASHIVHRNLKSSTIRLDPRGVAKITDFSLAITAGPGVDATARDGGHIVGTPCFLSPEQAQGTHLLTTHSDMYALGVVLYHLVTGHVPFEDRSVVSILTGHIKDQVPPPHHLNKHVPVEFSWFTHRLMMKNPNNRYSDWADVLRDIHAMLAGAQPLCVRPEEEYLSTIRADFGPQPAPASGSDEGAEGARVRLRPKTKNSAIASRNAKRLADDHAQHHRQEARLQAAVCWAGLAAWLALLFWFRAFYQADPAHADTSKSLSNLSSAVTKNLSGTLDELKALADKDSHEMESDEAETAPAEVAPPAAAPTQEPAAQPAPAAPQQEPAAQPAPVAPQQPAPAASATAVAPVAQPAVVPSAELPAGIPPGLRQSLAQALAAGDLPAARNAVKAAPENFKERAALQTLLDATPDPDSLVADYLRAQVGRPLLFEHNGKQRTVIPRGVDNGVIKLESNGRGVDVAISQLSPDERLRWMDKPAGAPQTLAYCLALMRSSRRAEVAVSAAGCAPLAEVVVLAAELVPAAATPPAAPQPSP